MRMGRRHRRTSQARVRPMSQKYWPVALPTRNALVVVVGPVLASPRIPSVPKYSRCIELIIRAR